MNPLITEEVESLAEWLDENMSGTEALMIRQQYKMTQSQFAEYIGVRQATVSDWENGKATISRLAKLAIRAAQWRIRAEGEADELMSLRTAIAAKEVELAEANKRVLEATADSTGPVEKFFVASIAERESSYVNLKIQRGYRLLRGNDILRKGDRRLVETGPDSFPTLTPGISVAESTDCGYYIRKTAKKRPRAHRRRPEDRFINPIT